VFSVLYRIDAVLEVVAQVEIESKVESGL